MIYLRGELVGYTAPHPWASFVKPPIRAQDWTRDEIKNRQEKSWFVRIMRMRYAYVAYKTFNFLLSFVTFALNVKEFVKLRR